MPALTVAQLAQICEGQAEGDTQRSITAANSLANASEGELAFAATAQAIQHAVTSRAGCLLVPLSFTESGPWSLIRVSDPRRAFTRAVREIYPAVKPAPFVHPTAIIAATAVVASDCFIGPYVTIGENSTIASGCSIGNGCAIGSGVSIGDETVLHANTTIYNHVRIGARVILHSGCVIGADGFGFTLTGDHYEKFPQVGTVDIGDDVEVGANCCVDRAALGVTRIGYGTKLDNLVHVAHNCDIGSHVVIAAQTGFSGGVVVGDYAMIGGQAGFGDGAVIDAKAVVGGKAGILPKHRVHSGEPVWGIPARPLRQHLKGLAHVAKLSDYQERLKDLELRLAAIERREGL